MEEVEGSKHGLCSFFYSFVVSGVPLRTLAGDQMRHETKEPFMKKAENAAPQQDGKAGAAATMIRKWNVV